jgi:hypothetical protein
LFWGAIDAVSTKMQIANLGRYLNTTDYMDAPVNPFEIDENFPDK